MRYTKPVTSLFFIALLASSGAIAHETGSKDAHTHGHHYRVEGSFGHADANGDGNISRQEWFAESEHVFEQLDYDDDRHIDQDEFQALPEVKSLP